MYRIACTCLGVLLIAGAPLLAQSFTCTLPNAIAIDGLHAVNQNGRLEVTWQGEHNDELRAAFTIRNGQPVVQELAARRSNGPWRMLGHDLQPEYEMVSGIRRMSAQQWNPLKELGVAITPAVIEKEKWFAFWDAPLNIPGAGNNTSNDLPRKPEEIRRGVAQYHASACRAETNGQRLEITFPASVEMGIFSGSLQYTIYQGSSLLRQELIAKTDAPGIAYKYDGGLKGFTIDDNTRVVWRDEARAWQDYSFGGEVNNQRVALHARNRLGIVDPGNGGSLAFLPPPHKFFFSREIETNLGFVYYRKDTEKTFAVGARQAEREEPYRPAGVSEEVWDRREKEARHHMDNFALYNAPPGTMQHMPVYFYLSAADPRATQEAVLAYTHDDIYKPVPGFKVLTSHFHMHYNEALTDAQNMDLLPSWKNVFRTLGINVVILADFHADSHPNDPGPVRFAEEKVYFDGCRRNSDKDFLLIPGEEPDATFGGHYMMAMPHPVYWSHVKKDGQQFQENDPKYGAVYHIGSRADELAMLKQEGGYVWQAHPRTKGSTGYPDAVKDTQHFLSDRFLGGSYQSLPVDQSQKRLCENRCLDLLDEMNNWAGPKYMIAEGDTYMKHPDDETYPQLIVNYVKLDRVPRFNEDWSPVLKSMRAGDYFVSSGEILYHNWGVKGSGAKRTYTADIEYTFPLEFVELVWGDGKATHRQIIPATDLKPFGTKHFEIPFDATGKKWVRFAAWDSAGDGAFTQPVHLQ